MKNITSLQTQPSQDAIARKAYELWQTSGCPVGCDLVFWLLAEQQLLAVGHPGNGRAENTVVKRNVAAAPRKNSASPSAAPAERGTFRQRRQPAETRG